jgi:signal transduction histidine kinase/sensor domain CHASE-containing protein
MDKKIQIKIFFLIMALSVIFVSVLVIIRITESNKISALIANGRMSQIETMEHAVEMISKSPETFAYDYSYWDEMIAFLKKRDLKWAEINIDEPLSTFKTDAVWVFDDELDPVYLTNSKNKNSQIAMPVSLQALKNKLAQKPFLHFYAKVDAGIIEIFSAPIQPSDDVRRKTKPKGYLFTGKLINKDYLDQLAMLSSAQAEVSVDNAKTFDDNPEDFIVRTEKLLFGFDDAPVARIVIKKEYKIYDKIAKEAESQFYILLLFAVVIMAAIITFIHIFINRPLKSISGALINGSPEYLMPYINKRDEFGQISLLIDKFFKQKNQLTTQINERIQVEKELIKTKANLEELIERRNMQLSKVNKELAEDIALREKIEEEMLIERETSKLKSSLLLNLNHEFRTPLTGILGSAAILKEQLQSAPEGMFVDGIINSGNRLLRAFNSFLALSELELGNKELKGTLLSLNETVGQVVEKMTQEAAAKGVGMKFIAENKISILADEHFLKISIINILDNAIKFTHKGKIITSIKTETFNGKLFGKIEIADTGIGIPKEHINLIFNEFRQVSEGIGRRFEGNGLGLTIAKRIIERMGGGISVNSEVNKGSVFSIILPAEAEGFINDNGKEEQKAQGACEGEEGSGLKLFGEANNLLLVEDNFINAEVIVNFLEGRFNIDHAYNGSAAVEMAKNKNYSIILMDINLGEGLNGVETCAEIRKSGGYKNTPIIAVTGYAFFEEKENLLEAGLTDYLAKPFDKKDLVDLIEKYLQ